MFEFSDAQLQMGNISFLRWIEYLISQTFFHWREGAMMSQARAAKLRDHHLVVKGYCDLWFVSHFHTWFWYKTPWNIQSSVPHGAIRHFFQTLKWDPLIITYILPCWFSYITRVRIEGGFVVLEPTLKRKKKIFLNCDYPLKSKYWQYLVYFT